MSVSILAITICNVMGVTLLQSAMASKQRETLMIASTCKKYTSTVTKHAEIENMVTSKDL